MNLQLVPCPLCGQSGSFIDVDVPNTDVHINKYGQLYEGKAKSEWKVCGQCGFVHQNPRPSTEALNEFYTQSQYHDETASTTADGYLKFARWYFSEKIDFTIKQTGLNIGSAFDIGCGRGGVLKLYDELGWKTYGVEPDQGFASFAINQYGLTGVKQGILDSKFLLTEKVDLVFSNHAFEHFADLDEVMAGIRNIIKPGGFLFIAIPTYYKNKSSLSKRWMNSSHYSLFTHNSLNNLLVKNGFEEIVHTYSGWNKEVDDLWYLAKFTGKEGESRQYFENPGKVHRYLQIVNPLRSFIFYPIYSHWEMRVRLYNLAAYAAALFVTSPMIFIKKLFGRIGRMKKSN